MAVTYIKHNAGIVIGDYHLASSVKREVLRLLPLTETIDTENLSNVKSTVHTDYNWEPTNRTFNNLKAYIVQEIETAFQPGACIDDSRGKITCDNFWAMVYKKGDWANEHCHKPYDFSFAYFVKAKWYHAPLVFASSGKRIRPKEGRFVAFPGYLRHYVPKQKFADDRITLSGNMVVPRPSLNKFNPRVSL
tara:strand:+ start:182 stop:754 length:573 start_codon:yes stop_codon:yes gene_type:complete